MASFPYCTYRPFLWSWTSFFRWSLFLKNRDRNRLDERTYLIELFWMTNCWQAWVYQFITWKVEWGCGQSWFWLSLWRSWIVLVFICQMINNRFRETSICLGSWNLSTLFLLWQGFQSLRRQLFIWFLGIIREMSDRWWWHREKRQFCLRPFQQIFLSCSWWLFSSPVAWFDCRVLRKKTCLIFWVRSWTNPLGGW